MRESQGRDKQISLPKMCQMKFELEIKATRSGRLLVEASPKAAVKLAKACRPYMRLSVVLRTNVAQSLTDLLTRPDHMALEW